MKRAHTLPVCILCLLVTGFRPSPQIAVADEREFSRSSVDIGLVVCDLDKAEDFYTKAIGFRAAKGFSMPGTLARNIGLTTGKPLEVRVLVLGDEQSATRLKLIAMPKEKTAERNDRVVDSESGYRYMTVFVGDMNRTLKRLRELDVKPLGDGPVNLGSDSPHEVFVVLVRDPDGNLVELVGPMNDAE